MKMTTTVQQLLRRKRQSFRNRKMHFYISVFVTLLFLTLHQHPKQRYVISFRIPTINMNHGRKATPQPSCRLSLFVQQQQHPTVRRPAMLFSSFTSDGSEYSAADSDFDSEDDEDAAAAIAAGLNPNNLDGEENESGVVPTIELQPVPTSKNSGNRFITVIWDRDYKNNNNMNKDVWDSHYERVQCTEDHVLFCRKCNLYNATFNANSMVDILWSLPLLSSDLQRLIGHVMCLESTELHYVQDVLRKDPIVRMLLLGSDSSRDENIDHSKGIDAVINNHEENDAPLDISSIPIYRWRHIRDYSLRIDDGRDGYPCICIAMDDSNTQGTIDDDEVQILRQSLQSEYLETLIRSQRVIAVGPLHTATKQKDDPTSIPLGDLILFNAKDRDDAIQFCESLPTAMNGLYNSMRVHFYNTLDITGKFVSEDPLRDAPCEQMKEAMEYWGYPVSDEQTPWINQ